MWLTVAEAKAWLYMANPEKTPKEIDLVDLANPMTGKGRPPEQKIEEQIALERAEDASRRTRGL